MARYNCDKRTAQRAQRMADLLAQGASVAEAGRAMNLTKGETANTWRKIKADLGAQAC